MESVATRKLPLFALLSANAISLIGNQLTYVAIPWFVLQTTGSAAKTGIAAFATTLPALLAAFFGGPLVDRWGYKRTSVIADIASGLTVVLVPTLHHTIGLAFWQLIALTFLGALLDTPGGTARDSLLPDLAVYAGTRLERVNAINQAIWRAGGLLGPPLAGVLIVSLGPSNVLFLDAASFAASAVLIAGAVPARRAAAPENSARASVSYVAELREGMRFIGNDRLLLAIILSFTALNALSEPLFAVVLPVYARNTFGSVVALGLMLAAFALGGLAGTALFGAVAHRIPRRPLYIASFLTIAALWWPLLALPSLPLLLALLALRGFMGVPPNLLALTISQERIPAHLRGRVFGVGRSLALAALPPSVILVGFSLEVVGLRSTIVALAVIQLLLALTLLYSPALRDMGRAR